LYLAENTIEKMKIPDETVKGQTPKIFVDVDQVLRRKSGRFYPVIPRFLKNYLKRIIHQDKINETLNKYEDRIGLDFIESILTEQLTVDIEVRNEGNIPLDGRYIVVSNHPLGGLDGMALMHVIGKKRKDIKFIINDLLMELKNLQPLWIPVNVLGRNSAESVRIIEEIYESDDLILVFPAGLVSRKQNNGTISDLEWKKSFITKAIRHKRDIIPVHIDGKNSDFFYNLARFRKNIGLRFNIEMLYLPNEMFKQNIKKMTITFGKPIPYTFFSKSKTHNQWAQWVKEHVYGLNHEQEI
jgi:1-acyl-sn-glycerol-3-phosphate acyltransferase